jgi:ABC-type molybdate transport system permease subunit
MTLTTTQGATQIGPTAIPRMCQEVDFAASAANHTICQLWMSLQIAIQNQRTLLDKRLSAIVLLAILRIRQDFGNRDDKKAKFSAMMLIVFSMTSLYLAEAKASRGKARFFSARGGIRAATLDRTPPARRTSPDHPSRPDRTD